MTIQRIGSLLFFLACTLSATAQDSLALIGSYTLSATEIFADPLGHFYLMDNKRNITKYSPDGQLMFRYSNNRLGDVAWLDVNDPFHIQAYFDDYRKLVVLDNDLSDLESYNLDDLNLYDHPAIGWSYDNNFWIYDNNVGEVKKINKRGETLLQSDNIFYRTEERLAPVRLIESKKYVFLVDLDQGIFVFDLFGKFIKQIETKLPISFQIRNDVLIYFQNEQLHLYGITDNRNYSIDLPALQNIRDVKLASEEMYLLTENKVLRYRMVFRKKEQPR